MITKPKIKPKNPNFSSCPCSKRPEWSLNKLSEVIHSRSYRSAPLKAKLKQIIELHRSLLGIPADYKIGIVPGSNTGAFEMAMWSMLGARGVDVFAWEHLSMDWLKDITSHLNIDDVRKFQADYGDLPDMSQADPARDSVFVWNGRTSGVRVPNGNWISGDREGLMFCDASSAVFTYDIPWDKLDVTTWSWLVLGSEAAHGMLVLSPRAVERLESYVPENRPLPKIFRLTENLGDNIKLNNDIFEGITINTPSILAVEDCLDALNWVDHIGGVSANIRRSEINFDVIDKWVSKTPWVGFLAKNVETQSRTPVCLNITDAWFMALSDNEKTTFIEDMIGVLNNEGAAYDIAGHQDAPAGLRIWCGATVSSNDLEELTPWLDWAFDTVKAQVGALN